MKQLLIIFSDAPDVVVPEFLENPWILAILGWFLYNIGKLMVDQKKYDLDNNGLGWSEVGMYLKFNWIGMLFSSILLVFVLPYTHNLWHWGMELWGKDWEFINLAYGLIGVLMIAIQIGVKYIKDKFFSKK